MKFFAMKVGCDDTFETSRGIYNKNLLPQQEWITRNFFLIHILCLIPIVIEQPTFFLSPVFHWYFVPQDYATGIRVWFSDIAYVTEWFEITQISIVNNINTIYLQFRIISWITSSLHCYDVFVDILEIKYHQMHENSFLKQNH